MFKKNSKKIQLEQKERMKKLCLDNDYSCMGDIYKLFKYDNLNNLILNIPVGNVKLKSSILYGKDVITREEKFLENLNNYIGYVKDTYHINYIEELLIIDISLNSKYADVLYSEKDYHEEENYYYYSFNFKKMFLNNFIQNILYFDDYVEYNSSIHTFALDLKKYNFNDETELNTLENIVKNIIKVRNDNLYDSFIPYNEMKKRSYNFYITKLEMILDDYYNKFHTIPVYISENDNYIILDNHDYLIFNIENKIVKNKDISITFGLKNNNFKAKKENIIFRYKEWNDIINRLKYTNNSDRYEEKYCFVDSTISFEIWNDDGNQCIDIIFEYNNSGDSYRISLSTNDNIKFYNLIENQIKKQIKCN